MTTVLQFVVLAFLSLIAALKLELLEPNEKTMWYSGTEVEVFWKVQGGTEGKSLKNLEIDLMQGRSKRPELVNNIAFGVDSTHGDAFWTVDPKLSTGDDYFVRITSPDDREFVYESKYFTIKNAPHGRKNKSGMCDKSNGASVALGPGLLVGMGLTLSTILALI